MAVNQKALLLTICSLIFLHGCDLPHRYDNEYQPTNRTIEGAFVGGFAGATSSAAFGTPLPASLLIGTTVGGAIGYSQDSRLGNLHRLSMAGIRVVRYGDSVTVVLPTDLIFYRNSARIDPESYPFLIEIAGLIERHAKSKITIEAYSDDIGGLERQLDLTQKQAQSVLAYLWSHGVKLQNMRAVGWGPEPDAANNLTVEGSAMNRRVTIQFKM